MCVVREGSRYGGVGHYLRTYYGIWSMRKCLCESCESGCYWSCPVADCEVGAYDRPNNCNHNHVMSGAGCYGVNQCPYFYGGVEEPKRSVMCAVLLVLSVILFVTSLILLVKVVYGFLVPNYNIFTGGC